MTANNGNADLGILKQSIKCTVEHLTEVKRSQIGESKYFIYLYWLSRASWWTTSAVAYWSKKRMERILMKWSHFPKWSADCNFVDLQLASRVVVFSAAVFAKHGLWFSSWMNTTHIKGNSSGASADAHKIKRFRRSLVHNSQEAGCHRDRWATWN